MKWMNDRNLNVISALSVAALLLALFVLPSVSAVPPDDNGDGCLSIGEISGYVASWLQGQITIQQVASGVSWWLGGCQAAHDRSLLFSQAYDLTWPPPVVNDSLPGAESNPTGNPLGGFYGYDRIVSPSDADYIVHNKDEFLSALDQVQPGQIIYVDDNSVIDLTGVWDLYITTPNITIASGRGRNFSKGALIRNLDQVFNPIYDGGRHMLYILEPHVRITGLRFEGPETRTMNTRHTALFYANRDNPPASSFYHYETSMGIIALSNYTEIDNDEFFGWSNTAININTYNNYGPGPGVYQSSINNWVHHNYIHDNPLAGSGYGVSMPASTSVTAQGSALIEGNLFNYNRHSVASTGDHFSNYEARYNLELETDTQHAYDRHPLDGFGGDWTIIHHNTDRYYGASRSVVGIRGQPYFPGGTQIYDNWFYQGDLESAVRTVNNGTNVDMFDNLVNIFPSPATHLPVAHISVDKEEAKLGEPIGFSAKDSYVVGGSIMYVCWNYGDLSPEDCGFVGDTKMHSYSEPGRYTVVLRVVDSRGVPMETTRSVIVVPSDPTRVIASFWVRDTYNDPAYNDSPGQSGYFNKKVMIDDVTVWQKDVNDDGTDWEHVVLDITPYVHNASEFNFQIESLQDYAAPLYPAEHPFYYFEVYLDDLYIFNRDYSVDKFSDYEGAKFANLNTFNASGQTVYGVMTVQMYKEGDAWWTASAEHTNDAVSGSMTYVFDSGYWENSTAGSVRGIKEMIYVPEITNYLDIIDVGGNMRDNSPYVSDVSFVGPVNQNGNEILDHAGHSKFMDGNYVNVQSFDLSRDYVLDMYVFMPYDNPTQTLMYASNGNSFLHIYYDSNKEVVVEGNGFSTACVLSGLSHSKFEHIVIGKSCTGGTCALSCGSNNVVDVFDNPSVSLTLQGTSSVSFGGYGGAQDYMFGAINNVRIIKGPVSNALFSDLSYDKIQGSWYFRNGTGGTIQDASSFDKDVAVPGGAIFGTEGNRSFMHISSSNPRIVIPRDASMVAGDEFSIEFYARFDDLYTTNINPLLDTGAYAIYGRKFIPPGYPDGPKIHFVLPSAVRLGDSQWGGYGITSTYELKDGSWYHLVFTKYKDDLRLYLNGDLNKEMSVPGVPYLNVSAGNIQLGGFNGDISQLSIYDRTLSSVEAKTLYEDSLLACSDSDGDGYGVFPRSGVVNGCRLDGFDCDDSNAGVGAGVC